MVSRGATRSSVLKTRRCQVSKNFGVIAQPRLATIFLLRYTTCHFGGEAKRRAPEKVAINSARPLHFGGERRMPTREDAWKLLCEYTASESLRKHMLAVEACVRAYARKAGANEETWGLAALLHDFDYERWPNQEHSPDSGHPSEGAKILREQGYSEEVVRAIITHADYCGVPRQTALEHTLFACDERSEERRV